MMNVRKYNPVLKKRLEELAGRGVAADFERFFSGLSNAERRTAGYLLGEEIVPQLQMQEQFFRLFFTVVPANPKAFLGTFLKALVALYRQGTVRIAEVDWAGYARLASSVDRSKILVTLLPALNAAEEVETLLRHFGSESTEARVACLIRGGTVPCYYLLFQTLRRADDNSELLRRCCLLLMRKGDSVSFNMACVIRQYFGVENLPGTFSLKLKPYQLGRLDLNEQILLKLLKGE